MKTTLAAYVLSLIFSSVQPGKDASVETRDQAVARLEVDAEAIADTAKAFGARWPEGPVDFARALTAASLRSMGFRRDVQLGQKRGPAGEMCLMDLQPRTLRYFAPWETAGRTDDELVALTTGLDYASQRRCFDAGAAGLVNARRVAEHRCKGRVLLGTFALYASGRYCVTPAFSSQGSRVFPSGWIESTRLDTLRKFRARREIIWPAWYQPEESADDGGRVAEGS